MLVLGVETSCDETAAAIVGSDGRVHSDVVRSQIALHAPFGGIVPEIAARDHARAIVPVVRAALARADRTLSELDGVAVTAQPGLSGALLVGLQTAKGLAWASGLPLVGVDHLVGHVLAVFLVDPGAEPAPPPSFPFIALLASGGHTGIYRVDGPAADQIQELGATRDDAAGEAFDKAAKLLGLGYPGGPVIDRLAAVGDASRVAPPLPSPMAHKDSLEFSFSGVKTSLARRVAATGVPTGTELEDLCAAFQATIVRSLVRKTARAATREGIPRIVLGGGVAANRGLREAMTKACERHGIALFVPPLRYCTDNAAMIAYAGALRLVSGERDAMSLSPSTKTCLPRVTVKGRGPRRAARRPG